MCNRLTYLVIVLSAAWVASAAQDPADFNGEGMVNFMDFTMLMEAWGETYEVREVVVEPDGGTTSTSSPSPCSILQVNTSYRSSPTKTPSPPNGYAAANTITSFHNPSVPSPPAPTSSASPSSTRQTPTNPQSTSPSTAKTPPTAGTSSATSPSQIKRAPLLLTVSLGLMQGG